VWRVVAVTSMGPLGEARRPLELRMIWVSDVSRDATDVSSGYGMTRQNVEKLPRLFRAKCCRVHSRTQVGVRESLHLEPGPTFSHWLR
jgi:hypothetical protein